MQLQLHMSGVLGTHTVSEHYCVTCTSLPDHAVNCCADWQGKVCLNVQDGGCWVNLGPLLYHWADAHTYLAEEEVSVELSLEEVEAAAKQVGFKTVKREMVPAAYMTNLRYKTSSIGTAIPTELHGYLSQGCGRLINSSCMYSMLLSVLACLL